MAASSVFAMARPGQLAIRQLGLGTARTPAFNEIRDATEVSERLSYYMVQLLSLHHIALSCVAWVGAAAAVVLLKDALKSLTCCPGSGLCAVYQFVNAIQSTDV